MPGDVFSSLVREVSVWAAERAVPVSSWWWCKELARGAFSEAHTSVGVPPGAGGVCGEHVNQKSNCWASEMYKPGSLHATCAVLWAGQPAVGRRASKGWGLWPAPAQAGAKLFPLLPPEQQSNLKDLSSDARAGC